jgi:hypothetical protein
MYLYFIIFKELFQKNKKDINTAWTYYFNIFKEFQKNKKEIIIIVYKYSIKLIF